MGANTSFPERFNVQFSGGGGPGLQRAPNIGRYTPQTMLSGDTEIITAREKKKKSSKLATLKKKLTRVRRQSRSVDHARAIRELTNSWTIQELSALQGEYEASLSLKELTVQANLARPHANSFKEDLSALYDYKYCTDVDLIYQGVCFPAHRVILSIRCRYFRKLLQRYPDFGSQVPVSIRTPGVDVHLFSSLLRYLYTGEVNLEESKCNYDILVQLGEEFGVPNPLEHDLRTLLESGELSDAELIFASDNVDSSPEQTPSPEASPGSGATCDHAGHSHPPLRTNALRCHKAILAARSPFFRNLLLRRARSGEELTEQALNTTTKIVLDESIIPKQYARVLLYTIYIDTVDLSHIVPNSSSMCSLSEVQAMVAGKSQAGQLDEAMEIYQIGEFLDFAVLSQGCEDIIVDNQTVETSVSILQWSSEPHGSRYVHLQALHFLREEFLSVAQSPVLHDINKNYLIKLLKSDFLQAGELDVLLAVLKWGEQQLVHRMEEREPNLLTHTAHSVTRKGVKKRDLNDAELREILADLLPLVRVEHVLPANSEVLSGAIKRGLVSRPPSHMIGDDTGSSSSATTSGSPRASAWVRSVGKGGLHGIFVKPRLFMPYYEEVKALLEEQVSQVAENEVVRLRMIQPTAVMSNIPDTLYMVDDHRSRIHSCLKSQSQQPQYVQQQLVISTNSPTCSPMSRAPASPTNATVDNTGTIMVPDKETLKAMWDREHQLHHTKPVQRAYSQPYSDRRRVACQIQLRVVREFGLPDTTVEILQSNQYPGVEEVELEHHHNTSPPQTATPPISVTCPHQAVTSSPAHHFTFLPPFHQHHHHVLQRFHEPSNTSAASHSPLLTHRQQSAPVGHPVQHTMHPPTAHHAPSVHVLHRTMSTGCNTSSGTCTLGREPSNSSASGDYNYSHCATAPMGRRHRSHDPQLSPSTPVSPVRAFSTVDKENTAYSESMLSEMMPDIAMATASLNTVSLHDFDLPPQPQHQGQHAGSGDLELDLGDGNNHSGSSTLRSGTGTLYI